MLTLLEEPLSPRHRLSTNLSAAQGHSRHPRNTLQQEKEDTDICTETKM